MWVDGGGERGLDKNGPEGADGAGWDDPRAEYVRADPDVRGCKLIPIDVTDVTLEPIKRSDEIFA